jgi:hypothetical protein
MRMAHTFWHCGILIGESELEEDPNEGRHLAGVFSPSAYGLQIFPRLTGILTAGAQLKTYLETNGLSENEMDRTEVERLFDTTPAGQKIIDIGRTLCDVEMRAADGKRVEFSSIAFSDLLELRSLLHDLVPDGKHDLDDLPDEAPRYIVSATLRNESSASREDDGVPRLPEPRWPADN